ncbi:MAG: hypothetical protein ACLVIJ_07400, partial [Clostridium sp.]
VSASLHLVPCCFPQRTSIPLRFISCLAAFRNAPRFRFASSRALLLFATHLVSASLHLGRATRDIHLREYTYLQASLHKCIRADVRCFVVIA